jgi:hypothetical protein
MKYVDFAVFEIGGIPALAMLEKDDTKNDIWIYKYSTIADGTTIDGDYNKDNMITHLDINDKSFNTLKAVKVDGETRLVAIQKSTSRDDHDCQVGIYYVNGVDWGAGYKDWNDQHSQYFKFNDNDDQNPGEACSDIDFIDWDADTYTEIATLREYPYLLSHDGDNDIFMYTVKSLPNNGDTIKLFDAKPYRTWLNAYNRQSEILYVADVNGDGKQEIMQADLTGDSHDSLIVYSNAINNKIGSDIANPDQVREKEIKMEGMPYIDLAAYDWLHNKGPKIA